VRKTIGPHGGLISSHDDVLTLVFQPGALSEDTEIEISPSDEPPPIFGLTYRVRPDEPVMVDVEVTYRRVLPNNPNGAKVGAIRLDDYSDEMGHWRALPRLALSVEQQSVIAIDDELSLYYGLLEDVSAPPLPEGGSEGTAGSSGDPDGTATSGTTGPGTTGADTAGSGAMSTLGTTTSDEGEPSTGDESPGLTTTGMGTGMGTGSTDEGMGSSSSDGGMMMQACSNGVPEQGDLCLVMGVDYPAGLGPIDVGVADFDGGALDVVTLDAGSLELGLLSGAGDGTLGAPVGGFAVGAMPAEMGVGDFDGDGTPDVVVLDTATDSVGLLVGNGAGGFAAQVLTAAGAGVVDLSVADFDDSAQLDVGVLNATDGTMQILLGGAGGLTAGTIAAVGAGVDLVIGTGDLNGDGFEDLIGVGAATYHAWAGDGTGVGFIGEITNPFGPGGTFVEVQVGDIDEDTVSDIVAIDVATNTMVVGMGTGGPASFDFMAVPAVMVGTTPSDVVLADLDGDGDLDAVVTNAGSNDVMVFEWDGGAFGLAFTFATGTAPSGVAVGDLNADGVPDLVVANEGSDSVTVVLSDP